MYGLSSFDPSAHAYVIGVLSIAAVAASWIPARSATRVDPIDTLKQE
jgi:ABC-type lipoprotein release transport system permease subunit